MNVRVSELTELALQILDYQMYDQNGKASNSLCQLIEKHQVNRGQEATQSAEDKTKLGKRKVSPDPNRDALLPHEEQFMAEYDILEMQNILDDPKQYVETQLASCLVQLQSRLMQQKPLVRYKKQAKEMLEKNAKANQKEVVSFCAVVRKGCMKAIRSMEDEYGAAWTRAGSGVVTNMEAKKNELLEEFNMLLQLLKIIIDDVPDDWKELDKILKLLQTSNDSLKFI